LRNPAAGSFLDLFDESDRILFELLTRLDMDNDARIAFMRRPDVVRFLGSLDTRNRVMLELLSKPDMDANDRRAFLSGPYMENFFRRLDQDSRDIRDLLTVQFSTNVSGMHDILNHPEMRARLDRFDMRGILDRPEVGDLGLLWIVTELVAAFLFLMVLFRAWREIQVLRTMDPTEKELPSPVTAIGYLFLPLFQFYWFYVSMERLRAGLNKVLDACGIALPYPKWLNGVRSALAPSSTLAFPRIFKMPITFFTLNWLISILIFFLVPWFTDGTARIVAFAALLVVQVFARMAYCYAAYAIAQAHNALVDHKQQ